jgi:methanogenic corrinoid protein MtbC1
MDEMGSLAAIHRRLEAGESALALMDECRTGMERVGELYEQGTYFISALIMAGEIFREAAEILLPRLELTPRPLNAGRVVMATVKGDIHDIGKNIVITLLDAHGFTVVDLGVDVPAETIADAVEAERPDVLGLSCLLTTGFTGMRQTIAAVRKRTAGWPRRLPVVIGGAPIDQTVADQSGADGWCTDGIHSIAIVRTLLQ